MRCRFAFSQTSDGRLLVIMEALWGFAPGLNGKFCVSAIDDENTFIQHVVLADLEKEETVELIACVLLVVSGRKPLDQWVSVTLNHLQLTALGMRLETDEAHEPGAPPVLGFVDAEDLARVFTQAPIPVCMLAGPNHIITFINPAYVRLLGRTSEDLLLGKTVREALSELEGQPFFPLLDKVYKSGEPFIGIEMSAQLHHEGSKMTRESFFDFVYHPVRDRDGHVCGILCQATDVTERVLEKQVRESREEQLYRQWAEVDAMYRDSPLGLSLVSAKGYRILRINKVRAKQLGATPEELLGKRITDVFPPHPALLDTYDQAVHSKSVKNFEVLLEGTNDSANPRASFWILNPILDESGNVEAIHTVVLDITARPELIRVGSNQEVSLRRNS